MDHLCHRCHAVIAENAPFCAQCGAPQIRVSSESIPAGPEPQHPPQQLAPPPAMDWKRGFSAALKAGLLMVLLSTLVGRLLPLTICCLWPPLAGIFAVWLYQRSVHYRQMLTAGEGARLGALAGFLGFVLFTLLLTVSFTVGRSSSDVRSEVQKQLIEKATQFANENPGPQAQDIVHFVSTPEGVVTIIAISLLMMFLAFVIFAAIGGALGTRLLAKPVPRE